MISKKPFGMTADGKNVTAFTLSEGKSYAVILDYGGTIQSLVVAARDASPVDVVLGYDTLREYEENGGYLGALIGRFGNRIGAGKLTVDGRMYQLFLNDNGNHLHGGNKGFDKKIWDSRIEGDELILTLVSKDGEENYPGKLTVEVRYSFDGATLRIHYRAAADKKTVINLTSHAYFNLNGAGGGSVLDHVAQLDSDEFVPTDPAMIPVGGFREVKGTAFDFNAPKPLGRDIAAADKDLRQAGGYDHCFLLNNRFREYIKFAEVYAPKTGITLACHTDMPAVQLYTGNGLDQDGKGGHYGKNDAFCLETEFIPNNPNVPEYQARGSSYLEAGEVFESTTAYTFGVKE